MLGLMSWGAGDATHSTLLARLTANCLLTRTQLGTGELGTLHATLYSTQDAYSTDADATERETQILGTLTQLGT